MGTMAARVFDNVAHPLPGVLQPGPGAFNVLIGYRPAWRGVPAAAAAAIQAAKTVSDTAVTAAKAAATAAMGTPAAPAAKLAEEAAKAAALAAMSSMMSSAAAASATPSGGIPDTHVCATFPPTPAHGPGLVLDGNPTILINGLPACQVGDKVTEALGPPDPIIMGQFNVILGENSGGGGGGGGAGGGGLLGALATAMGLAAGVAAAALSIAAGLVEFVIEVGKAAVNAAIAFGTAIASAVANGIAAFVQAVKGALDNAAPATPVRPIDDPAVQQGMREAWADSQASDPDNRHEEGGYIVRNPDGTLGVERWPRGGGATIPPPPRDADGNYNGKEVLGEFHTHPNPPVDENGDTWEQGGHQGDWDGIAAENYPGDSYIISDGNVYNVDSSGQPNLDAGGNDDPLGTRTDMIGE